MDNLIAVDTAGIFLAARLLIACTIGLMASLSVTCSLFRLAARGTRMRLFEGGQVRGAILHAIRRAHFRALHIYTFWIREGLEELKVSSRECRHF